jgi:ATP adenylyltransferase/5',5'''-P-1,P-4-tetraphosphate phosphorylase II
MKRIKLLGKVPLTTKSDWHLLISHAIQWKLKENITTARLMITFSALLFSLEIATKRNGAEATEDRRKRNRLSHRKI